MLLEINKDTETLTTLLVIVPEIFSPAEVPKVPLWAIITAGTILLTFILSNCFAFDEKTPRIQFAVNGAAGPYTNSTLYN